MGEFFKKNPTYFPTKILWAQNDPNGQLFPTFLVPTFYQPKMTNIFKAGDFASWLPRRQAPSVHLVYTITKNDQLFQGWGFCVPKGTTWVVTPSGESPATLSFPASAALPIITATTGCLAMTHSSRRIPHPSNPAPATLSLRPAAVGWAYTLPAPALCHFHKNIVIFDENILSSK